VLRQVPAIVPSIPAERKCPDLIFVKPRFDACQAISLQSRVISAEYTPIIEPLSLDEAYLGVTEPQRYRFGDTDRGKEAGKNPRRNQTDGVG
jgi:nucleotidyltransferase/DNA polymerase involved in DNA repair